MAAGFFTAACTSLFGPVGPLTRGPVHSSGVNPMRMPLYVTLDIMQDRANSAL